MAFDKALFDLITVTRCDFTNLNYRRTEEKNKAQGAKKQFFRSLIGAASVRRRLNSKVKHTPDAEMSIWDA